MSYSKLVCLECDSVCGVNCGVWWTHFRAAEPEAEALYFTFYSSQYTPISARYATPKP